MKIIKKSMLISCTLFMLFFSHIINAQSHNLTLPDSKDIRLTDSKLKLDEVAKKLPKEATLDNPMLWLVNGKNPLKTEPQFDISYLDGKPIASTIEQPLTELLAAAAKDGYNYTVVSGYRSMELQEANRQASIANYQAEGLSYDEALSLTDQYFAPSNASEHTTGLAVDLLGNEWIANGGELTASYAQEPSAQWLAKHAPEYGFILRYLEDKSDLTGYNFEPWHFRYVGKENAQFMTQYHLTLEEYLTLIKTYPKQ